MRLVLGTKNPGKIREVREICKDTDIELVTLDDLNFVPTIIEDGNSFKENALKKAKVIANCTGEFSIADDSGLEVDYLNGRPGIFSSRYAGEDATDEENVKKLLKELEGVPSSERGAAFRCVIALIGPGVEKTFEGKCGGLIASEAKGENGFGYDPIFYIPFLDRTMAELDPGEKNCISHRGEALKGLKAWLMENKRILTQA